jgi:hypothetical protein
MAKWSLTSNRLLQGVFMAKLLWLLTSNHLPLTAVNLNPDSDIALFHVRKLSSFLKERQWFYSGVFA